MKVETLVHKLCETQPLSHLAEIVNYFRSENVTIVVEDAFAEPNFCLKIRQVSFAKRYRHQFTDPNGWIAWLARAQLYVYNLVNYYTMKSKGLNWKEMNSGRRAKTRSDANDPSGCSWIIGIGSCLGPSA